MTNDKLAEIKRKKLEELKNRYIKGEIKMDENKPDTPIKVTDADIDQNVEKFDYLVIDCWAPWCGPCRMVGPVIEELAKEMQGKIVFGKLNVDENQNTAGKFGIMSIPTILVFKKGELVDRLVGAMPKDTLKQRLQNI